MNCLLTLLFLKLFLKETLVVLTFTYIQNVNCSMSFYQVSKSYILIIGVCMPGFPNFFQKSLIKKEVNKAMAYL